ncbi:MAG: hypothetical protein NTY38_19315 [Acidobacteria bacterium]|nr:hypothetical protein [Acidobacteriota bacterium]
MTFDKINRRTHLYVGLTLLPWFFMYGVSSFFFSHPGGSVPWLVISERPYHLDALPEGPEFDALGAKLLADSGIAASGRFGTYHSGPKKLSVYKNHFISPLRLTYDDAKQTLLVEKRGFHLQSIFVGAHDRGGYDKGGLFDILWAVIVDLFSLATIAWILSGLFMWWRLKRYYFWGGVAIAVGVGSFLMFLFLL